MRNGWVSMCSWEMDMFGGGIVYIPGLLLLKSSKNKSSLTNPNPTGMNVSSVWTNASNRTYNWPFPRAQKTELLPKIFVSFLGCLSYHSSYWWPATRNHQQLHNEKIRWRFPGLKNLIPAMSPNSPSPLRTAKRHFTAHAWYRSTISTTARTGGQGHCRRHRAELQAWPFFKKNKTGRDKEKKSYMFRYMPKGVSYICTCICICTIYSISFELFVAFKKSRQPERTLRQHAGCENCLSRRHLHPIFIFSGRSWNRFARLVVAVLYGWPVYWMAYGSSICLVGLDLTR